MIIKSITLRNIRSYLGQKIEFPEGNVLLAGDIGSGKSTILLAIEFALFGLKRGELSGGSLLRHGKKEGYVELNFSIGKKDIFIKRALKSSKQGVGQDSGFIVINGVKTDGTAVELKTKVLELFGYPQSFVTKQKDAVFRYTVYTPQEQMKQILFEEKDARLDTLRTIFDIDKYKRVRDNATVFVKDIKNKKSEFSGAILDLEEKKKELKKRSEELKEKEKLGKAAVELQKSQKQATEKAKKELESFMTDEKKFEGIKVELEIQNTKLDEKVRHSERNRKEQDKQKAEIAELTKKLDAIKIEKVEGEEEKIQETIDKIEKELNEAEKKKALLNEKCDSAKKESEKLEKETKEKEARLKDLHDRTKEIKGIEKEVADKKELEAGIEKSKKELDEIKRKSEECKISIRNAEKVKSDVTKNKECPTCLQEISEEHKHGISGKEDRIISQNENLLKELVDDSEQLTKQIRSSEQELEALRKKEQMLSALRVQLDVIKALEKEIETKRKTLDNIALQQKEYSEELSGLKHEDTEKKREEVREKKELMKKLREIEKLKAERDNIASQISEKQKDIAEIELESQAIKKEVGEINKRKFELSGKLGEFAGLEGKLSRAKKEYEESSMKERECDVKAARLEQEKEGIQRFVEALEKDILAKSEIKEKIARLSRTQQWLEDFFVNLIEVIERNVMSQLYNKFNELFQDWFRVLIEDESINVRLDDSFTPVIEQNGYETFIENLSGGEKTSCALAYRLALNKVINDFVGNITTKDLIILDEPTDGFSSEQLDRVRDVLEQLNIKQVIIVSHESKIESFVDNVIRITKHEHVSSVV